MARIHIPLLTFVLSIIFCTLAYVARANNYQALFWLAFVLLCITTFIFELSVLTLLFDLLTYQPIIATALLILALALCVVTGILLRWITGENSLYWLASTIFPVIAGSLYVIDILQKD